MQEHLTACVNHEILLQKLRYYGVVGSSYYWLAIHVFGRSSQQVCYHSKLSDSGDVTAGVPQGSLLFSLYVNDLLHAVVSSDVYQYADDT